MKKRISILSILLALLCAVPALGEAVLREEKLSGVFPVARDDGYDPAYPVPFNIDEPRPELEIWAGRVTVCDCFIVRCGGETMLIDGGDFNHGRQTYAFLDALGVTGVDYIFNTHHHDDHLEMEVYLMNHGFTAREFLTPYERNYPVLKQRNAEEAADKNGILYHTIYDGDEMDLGPAHIQFFRWMGHTNPNYTSMMCRITLGERSIFMLADVISKAQQALIVERPEIPWKSDIVKAGHHGYTTQEVGLMNMIGPELCIVTNSPLGGKKTIDQMKRLNIPTLITNQGTIYLHTNGGEHWYYMQDKSYRK